MACHPERGEGPRAYAHYLTATLALRVDSPQGACYLCPPMAAAGLRLAPAMVLAQAAAASDVSLFAAFLRSGAMAKFVFGLLAVLSLVSWTIMIGKSVRLRRAAAHGRHFLEVFRGSQRFSEVNASAARLAASPLVPIFQAGYVEIDAQVKAAREGARTAEPLYRIKSLAAIERSLRRALGVEIHALARGNTFLATTAAASPFIGLFGTVWGIMVAFRDIGLSGSTSLVAVAPGIAEALVNTAAGLVVAIPALAGYNYFSHRLRDFRLESEDFILDFINLAERNFT